MKKSSKMLKKLDSEKYFLETLNVLNDVQKGYSARLIDYPQLRGFFQNAKELLKLTKKFKLDENSLYFEYEKRIPASYNYPATTTFISFNINNGFCIKRKRAKILKFGKTRFFCGWNLLKSELPKKLQELKTTPKILEIFDF